MQTGRDEMVGVLTAHQAQADPDGDTWGCSCGEMLPDDRPTSGKPIEWYMERTRRWFAEHQADMLAAASIYPFRPTHASEDTAAANVTCNEHDTWVDTTNRPHRRVIRPCRRARGHQGSHEALNTDGTPHLWRREERNA